MTTMLEMKHAIAREFVNEQYEDDEAVHAIRAAIKHYEKEQFWFCVGEFTITTVAGQRSYESADITSLLKVHGMAIGTCEIHPRQMAFFGDENGQPNYYTRVGKALHFHPIPDAVYQVKVYAWKKFAIADDDTENNPWFDDGEELIRQSAKRRLAKDILHADDLADRCAGLEIEAYDQLLKETRLRRPEQLLQMPDGLMRSIGFNVMTGQ